MSTPPIASAKVEFPPPEEATGARRMLAEPAEAPSPAPDPADHVVALPAATAIVVGGVLLAIIAVGAIISLIADRPLSGPGVDPPAPTEAPLTVKSGSGPVRT